MKIGAKTQSYVEPRCFDVQFIPGTYGVWRISLLFPPTTIKRHVKHRVKRGFTQTPHDFVELSTTCDRGIEVDRRAIQRGG